MKYEDSDQKQYGETGDFYGPAGHRISAPRLSIEKFQASDCAKMAGITARRKSQHTRGSLIEAIAKERHTEEEAARS